MKGCDLFYVPVAGYWTFLVQYDVNIMSDCVILDLLNEPAPGYMLQPIIY